uniref:Neurogenic locus notch homolog protein 1-like n=1 Tax=Crassostrea virginica TaxID=6565 RepID=A0A8B8CFN1_CRAVI|nr:neurogenic locus notch homolog protein 1-like [Crassostrea virginica]
MVIYLAETVQGTITRIRQVLPLVKDAQTLSIQLLLDSQPLQAVWMPQVLVTIKAHVLQEPQVSPVPVQQAQLGKDVKLTQLMDAALPHMIFKRCDSQSSVCNDQPCNSVGTLECQNHENIRRICKCRSGYTGKDCETNIDDCASNPCLYGGTCTDLVNGYQCTCPVGYLGQRCENRVNPCSLNRCSNGDCVDAYPMDLYRCRVCQYEMQVNNGTSLTQNRQFNSISVVACRQQCELDPSCRAFTFASATCKLYYTVPSGSDVTSVDGSILNIRRCIDPVDDYWSPWYNQASPSGGKEEENRAQLSTDLTCHFDVSVWNKCLQWNKPIDAECRVVGSKQPSTQTGNVFSMPCGVDGVQCTDQTNNPCQDYEVRYKCAVYKAFESNTCSIKNFCSSNPCQNNGVCSTSFNDFVCSCPTGYTGKLCQHDINACETNPCLSGGTCVDKPGNQGFECVCAAGYTGPLCQSNIDDCTPYPCDSTGSLRCEDAVNDYICHCRAGYTGKNCSIEIDECAAEPCMHGGNCTDGCPSSTYGEVCENSPNICRDLSPCLNGASCTEGVNSIAKCTCPNNYYRGIGCQLMVNHCADANICENGGTVSIWPQDSDVTALQVGNTVQIINVLSLTGYAGANCSINTNDCTNNCPATSTCIDMVNAHYCRCPLGKTGESCIRDLDSNYDLYFYLTNQDGYAALPYPIYMNGDSFSISVWSGWSDQVLTLDHEGLAVYDSSGQNPQRAAYQQQTVTDGQWNYVVVSWKKDSGFDLVVNSLRQSTILNTPYTSTLAEK